MQPTVQTDTHTLYCGDARALAATLPNNSVHCIVTSPPYYGLRDYGVNGQIGLEDTPEAYVAGMVDLFRELRRVLRDDGTLWLNLGDSYAGNASGDFRPGAGRADGIIDERNGLPCPNNLKPKDLIGIPWRVALALQADGWWLRSDIIWHKPNPMPESVTDRPTKAHEYLFLLTKSARYFYDADAVREPHKIESIARDSAGWSAAFRGRHTMPGEHRPHSTDHSGFCNSRGRNKRSVWTVSTKPYPEAHFATFPPDLIEPCILAGTSARGVCAECGAPWVRVVEREAHYTKRQDRSQPNGAMPQVDSSVWQPATVTDRGWEPSCTCNVPTVPATVLDPFNGAATTGLVALRHQRRYIGIELNAEYVEMSRRRLEPIDRELTGQWKHTKDDASYDDMPLFNGLQSAPENGKMDP